MKLGIDPPEPTNPSKAVAPSAVVFTIGARLPLIAIIAPPAGWRVPVAFAHYQPLTLVEV